MTNTATKLKVHDKYLPLWNRDTRYILVTGGRGSAKSFAVSTFVCRCLTTWKNWKFLYTRYTMQSAEISVIPEFTEKIDLLGKTSEVSVTKTLVECSTTGSSIIFSGIKTQSGNQTARLKSIPGLNVFIVDEAEEFREEKDFDTIDDSIRQKNVPNLVIIVMNPQDTEHWIWKRWFEKSHRMDVIDGVQIPISTHPDITHIHTTWMDNEQHLNADYITGIRKLRIENPAKYAHRYLGKWLDKKEGVIYPNWVEGEFDNSLPFGYGLDFGFYPDPLALVKVAVDTGKKRIYLHEELYETNLSYEQVIQRISQVVQADRMIIADTSEPRMTDALQASGLNVQKADKYPDSVVDGIKRINDFTLVVTPESYNLKNELRNYIWNDRKSSTPVDAYNHGLDAGRYISMRLMEGSDFLGQSW